MHQKHYFYTKTSLGWTPPPQRRRQSTRTKGGLGSFSLGGGTWRARGARAYSGGLGQSPQRGPGAEPLVRGQGRSPPEAESFLALGRAMDRANLYPLQYFQQSITIRSKCVRCRHSKIGGNNLFQIIQGTAKTNCTQVCFFACNLFSGVGTS